MTVTLKPIRPGDEPLLARIAGEVFDAPLEAPRLAACLAQPNHRMIVALDSGEVVGKCTAAVHHRPDKVAELYIDEIDVAPAHRRQGIARAMLDAMFAWGASQGCGEAWVGTEDDNEAAQALYRARGADPVPIAMYEYDL